MDLVSGVAESQGSQGAQDSSVLSAELSRRIREGDKVAEDQLIRHLQPGLRMMLSRRLGGDHTLVDDLVQETLVVLLKRLRGEGLEDPAALAAFAAQTARNLTLGVRRRQTRRRTDLDNDAVSEIASPTPELSSQVSDEAAVSAIRKMLGEMRHSRDRSLLKRFYLDDDDKGDLCREFGMNEAALNQALSRARSRFRAILKKHGLDKSDLLEVVE